MGRKNYITQLEQSNTSFERRDQDSIGADRLRFLFRIRGVHSTIPTRLALSIHVTTISLQVAHWPLIESQNTSVRRACGTLITVNLSKRDVDTVRYGALPVLAPQRGAPS